MSALLTPLIPSFTDGLGGALVALVGAWAVRRRTTPTSPRGQQRERDAWQKQAALLLEVADKRRTEELARLDSTHAADVARLVAQQSEQLTRIDAIYRAQIKHLETQLRQAQGRTAGGDPPDDR
jgi:hypothetical protein